MSERIWKVLSYVMRMMRPRSLGAGDIPPIVQGGEVAATVIDTRILRRHSSLVSELPKLKAQEIPFDHPDSCNMFQPGPDKPFVATPDAIAMYQHETILACLLVLQAKAREESGIDYLQVFDGAPIGKSEDLWYIEDGPGGAITALLPSNY